MEEDLSRLKKEREWLMTSSCAACSSRELLKRKENQHSAFYDFLPSNPNVKISLIATVFVGLKKHEAKAKSFPEGKSGIL